MISTLSRILSLRPSWATEDSTPEITPILCLVHLCMSFLPSYSLKSLCGLFKTACNNYVYSRKTGFVIFKFQSPNTVEMSNALFFFFFFCTANLVSQLFSSIPNLQAHFFLHPCLVRELTLLTYSDDLVYLQLHLLYHCRSILSKISKHSAYVTSKILLQSPQYVIQCSSISSRNVNLGIFSKVSESLFFSENNENDDLHYNT